MINDYFSNNEWTDRMCSKSNILGEEDQESQVLSNGVYALTYVRNEEQSDVDHLKNGWTIISDVSAPAFYERISRKAGKVAL